MNANKMADKCTEMMQKLWDDAQIEGLFFQATEIIEEIAGANWDRDLIHTERITKAITEYFRKQTQAVA